MDRAEFIENELAGRIVKISKDLGGLNINSGAEIALLCDKEGITYPRTADGNPSFVKEWLAAHEHPIMRMVTQARTWVKYRDTFIRSYIYGMHCNGRLHCQFNQLRGDDSGTVSGRFSSSNPNLQNIPKRGEGKFMRGVYVPELDEDWVRFDWSQIEFRLLVHTASIAKQRGADEAVRMYHEEAGTDFHIMVSEMTQLVRDDAKNINFGLVYGMGVDKLARSTGRSVEEATPLLDLYHHRVPFVRGTYNLASRTAKNRGYIRTLLGRMARFPGGEYTHKALNRALQGGAADIMKLAMVEIWESGACDILGAPLVTVHDELGLSVPRTREAYEALREIHHIMEHCVDLRIPLIAECERGPNWAECKSLKILEAA